ncbi:MAG: DUF2344 domain-containing protein, partial [Clostridia bacterium]|nr:DUF2344 domain-containing protein [Clostridia bacterium]
MQRMRVPAADSMQRQGGRSMITLKYCKKDAMRFVSHIDGMRNQMRAMRRTGLDVAFSQGFNPHMLLNMG